MAGPGGLCAHEEEFGFYWKVGFFPVQDIYCLYAPAKRKV